MGKNHLKIVASENNSRLSSILQKELKRINPLIVLEDLVNLAADEGYVAVKRKALAIDGIHRDIAYSVSDEPAAKDPDYSIPIIWTDDSVFLQTFEQSEAEIRKRVAERSLKDKAVFPRYFINMNMIDYPLLVDLGHYNDSGKIKGADYETGTVSEILLKTGNDAKTRKVLYELEKKSYEIMLHRH